MAMWRSRVIVDVSFADERALENELHLWLFGTKDRLQKQYRINLHTNVEIRDLSWPNELLQCCKLRLCISIFNGVFEITLDWIQQASYCTQHNHPEDEILAYTRLKAAIARISRNKEGNERIAECTESA